MRKRKVKTYPLANADLWQELDQLAEKHIIICQWVKGHAGHPDNERCDELAGAQSAQHTDVLAGPPLPSSAAAELQRAGRETDIRQSNAMLDPSISD
jgi:ribonuclease HI